MYGGYCKNKAKIKPQQNILKREIIKDVFFCCLKLTLIALSSIFLSFSPPSIAQGILDARCELKGKLQGVRIHKQNHEWNESIYDYIHERTDT